jgi:hypothetical protein
VGHMVLLSVRESHGYPVYGQFPITWTESKPPFEDLPLAMFGFSGGLNSRMTTQGEDWSLDGITAAVVSAKRATDATCQYIYLQNFRQAVAGGYHCTDSTCAYCRKLPLAKQVLQVALIRQLDPRTRSASQRLAASPLPE